MKMGYLQLLLFSTEFKCFSLSSLRVISIFCSSAEAVAFQATTMIDYEASASIPAVRTNKSESSTPARLASYESIPNTLFLPTSMLKATQFIHHTPVLSTSKLQPNVVKTISTPIEPSSSRLNVSTTTSLSPIAKKQRQLREGKALS